MPVLDSGEYRLPWPHKQHATDEPRLVEVTVIEGSRKRRVKLLVSEPRP